jgi:hypothetical protein
MPKHAIDLADIDGQEAAVNHHGVVKLNHVFPTTE